MAERLYFSEIFEDRGSYFVEYQPPVADNRFATIDLVFPDEVDLESVAGLMAQECRHWLARYPVPLMVTAWDAKESMIKPAGKPDRFLVGWRDPATEDIQESWNMDDLTAFLDKAPPLPELRTIYTDVSVRTDAEVKAAAEKNRSERRKGILFLRVIFVLWVAVIPAAVAAFEFWGPEWLGLIVLVYAWSQAWKSALKIWGRHKPSKAEEEKAERQRKMAHYFYHCERNPEGFARLKIENFEKGGRERTLKRSDILKGRST